MTKQRKLSRRSFLARVAGGVVAAGGALSLVGEPATAHPITDSDPRDRAGQGRSTAQWPSSDGDRGARADPAGRAGRLGHFSDSDSGSGSDPAGHGRRYSDRDTGVVRDPRNQRPSLTDSDRGIGSDVSGRGRRPQRR